MLFEETRLDAVASSWLHNACMAIVRQTSEKLARSRSIADSFAAAESGMAATNGLEKRNAVAISRILIWCDMRAQRSVRSFRRDFHDCCCSHRQNLNFRELHLPVFSIVLLVLLEPLWLLQEILFRADSSDIPKVAPDS